MKNNTEAIRLKLKHYASNVDKSFRYKLVLHILHLFFWLFYVFFSGTEAQRFDAYNYIYMAPNNFYNEGSFDFFHFKEPLRGYTFPLLGWFISQTSDITNIHVDILIALFNIAVLAFLSSVLIPTLMKQIVPASSYIVISSLSIVFIFIAYRGYSQQFLTDFTAVACLIGALIFIFKKTKHWKHYLYIGLLISVMVNVRPSYIPIFYTMLVTVAFIILRKAYIEKKTALLSVTALFVGLAVILLPQLIINNNVHDKKTVFTNGKYPTGGTFSTTVGDIPVGSIELSIFQTSVGIGIQRYDSSVGLEDPRVFYKDPEGFKIVEKDLPISSTKEYLAIIKNNPTTMTKVLLRHGLNGLDNKHPTPYPKYVEKSDNITRYLNYILTALFILLLIFLPKYKHHLETKKLLYLAIIFVASVSFAIVGAVETRFFLFPALMIFALTSSILTTKEIGIFKSKLFIIGAILLIPLISVLYTHYSDWVLSQANLA